MKPSHPIYRLYDLIGWGAAAVFLIYLAGERRVSWWVPAIGVPVGALLMYFRHRYYLPFVDEARARRKARENSGQEPT